MIMACLGPERAPPFAIAEHGFYLRTPAEWMRLAHDAGFATVDVELDNPVDRPQGLLLSAKT